MPPDRVRAPIAVTAAAADITAVRGGLEHLPPASRRPCGAGLRRTSLVAGISLGLCACDLLAVAPPPPPPAHVAPPPPPIAPAAAPAPPPAPPPDLAKPSDQAARRLLAYHEQLLGKSPDELLAEIARLDAQTAGAAATPDQALALALVLSMAHNPGDLARAADLVEPIASGTSPDLQPWLPMARLLAGAIAEQRRLEEQLATQVAHNRETQHTIQQLTEKLEALKAIERSMTARVAPSPANEAAAAPPARTP